MSIFKKFSLFNRLKDTITPQNRQKKHKIAGVSIAEVVVAMAVISIVSVAAIVAIQNSSVSMIKDMSAVESRTDASNNLEFFKFSDNLAIIQARILSNSDGEVESNEPLENGNRLLVNTSSVGVYTLKTEIEYVPDYIDETKGIVDFTSSKPVSIRAYAFDKDGNVLFDVGCEK